MQAPGEERTVFELEQQLKNAQAKLERLRALNTAKGQRYRERHREQYRTYKTAYMRRWRAAQRGNEGPSSATKQ